MIKELDDDFEDVQNETNEIIEENNIEEISIAEELENDVNLLLDENIDDNEENEENSKINILYNFHTNKHKREGKHALKRDVIFNGKIDKKQKDDYTDSIDNPFNSSYKIDSGSIFEFESKNNEEFVNQRELSNDVFNTLKKYTDLDFSINRRKPNKQSFNEYYILLLNKLRPKYTNSELFVELSYFFTDNIFNMFKLLDKKHATSIIKELKSKGYLKNLDNIKFI